MNEPPLDSGLLPAARPPGASEIVEARPVLAVVRYSRRRRRLGLPEMANVTRGDAALDFGLIALVALAIPIGAQFAFMAAVPGEEPDVAPATVLVVAKWFEALLVLVIAGYLVWRHQIPAACLGLESAGLGRQVLWSVPTFVAIYVAMIPAIVLIFVLVTLFPELQGDLVNRTRFVGALSHFDLATTVSLLVAVAIHEELLFRGLLIPYLRRLGCAWSWAIIMPAVVFALLHYRQGWLATIQVFGIAVVLGLFFVWSRSLVAVMIAHFLYDFAQLGLARFVARWIDEVMKTAPAEGHGLADGVLACAHQVFTATS